MVEVTTVSSPESRPQKSAEIIVEEIRRQIVSGELKPDDALMSETELTVEFNVSRPTLREALRILEAEQLIYVRRGAQGGARVRMPDATSASRSVGTLLQLAGTTMNDVWEARVLIEPPLARRLAERHRRSDLAALNQCLDEHRESLHDPEAFARSTARFHHLVLTRAGNQTLGLLAGILDEIFQRHAQAVVVEHRKTGDQLQLNQTTLRGHVRLVEIIESGDGEKAESAWRKHLELAGGVMLKRRGPNTIIDLYRSQD
jgi:GntR family transcriptional regulator, transcriptional repressor for pyruvate dehydrogenase complex